MHGGRLLMSNDSWRNAGHGCECDRELTVRAGHRADDDSGWLLDSEPRAGPDCRWLRARVSAIVEGLNLRWLCQPA